MGLASWNEDEEELKLFIRRRGANRMAKALYGQDPSLIWHLLHKLDVERALLLQKLCLPLKNSRAVNLIIKQILESLIYVREG